MKYQSLLSSASLMLVLTLTGCGGGDGGVPGGGIPGLGPVSTDYPYLKSVPQVTYIPSLYSPSTGYDVTVTLQADGPAPIYSVGLWINFKADGTGAQHLELVHMGGITWEGKTSSWVPLPPGDYYLDFIVMEDGDALAGSGLVKSGWYLDNDLLSSTYYVADQRQTDYTTVSIIDYTLGASTIPIVNFSLPPLL